METLIMIFKIESIISLAKALDLPFYQSEDWQLAIDSGL
jgi:hypothetical protein